MSREIGSEFWLSEIPKSYSKGNPEWIDLWGNTVLTSSGRGAISLMLDSIEEDVKYKTVLLPAYICESVIIPFIKKGYNCYFYDIGTNLEPNTNHIANYLGEKIGIFLHMGYYGFPTNAKIGNLIKHFKKNGTIIVEDITHTLFSYYKRYKENDYYIASLRKWFGIPSGGFLASKNREVRSIKKIKDSFSSIRKEALLIKGKYTQTGNQQLKYQFLKMFKSAEEELNNDPAPYDIDGVSNTIILKFDVNELILRRRENFSSLLRHIKDIKAINTVFDYLTNKICPFFFPIYVEKYRDEMRQYLIDEKVYCPVHWPIPAQIKNIESLISKKVYENIISIPCDQRYELNDMESIISLLKKFSIKN